MTHKLLISHRGNLVGPNFSLENSPSYIEEAIKQKFLVEIDLWVKNDKLFLGHDEPQYLIEIQWLKSLQNYLWIHCKNHEALNITLRNKLHCFFHDSDDYTITSWGYVWAYPGKLSSGPMCIEVLPERIVNINQYVFDTNFYGICSDYVQVLNEKYF